MSMKTRSAVVFLAWSQNKGRSTDIAEALGGDAVCIFPRWLSGHRLFLIRYVVSAAVTVRELWRLRPRSIIATNPPIFPGLIAWLYSVVAHAPFVLDSHPTSFGAKNHVASRRLLALHRWLARRAAAVLVTGPDWSNAVASWGASGIVVHEPPPPWTTPPPTERVRGRVLFVGVFGGDEPVECVVNAAALRPNLDVWITGDLRKCPPSLRSRAPANVTFVGYLTGDTYVRAVAAADVVVALTTEPTSIVRAGYEAVYARRPLIITGWSQGVDVFPFAVATQNDPAALARAFDAALTQDARDSTRIEAARNEQLRRWRRQEARLRIALGIRRAETPNEASTTTAVLP